MMRYPAASHRNGSLTRVRSRANGVSMVGQAGNTDDMVSDLAILTDSDPGRGFPVALRNTPDQGQTQQRIRIYAGQTANGRQSLTVMSPLAGDKSRDQR